MQTKDASDGASGWSDADDKAHFQPEVVVPDIQILNCT